jgi:hypothetical protein
VRQESKKEGRTEGSKEEGEEGRRGEGGKGVARKEGVRGGGREEVEWEERKGEGEGTKEERNEEGGGEGIMGRGGEETWRKRLSKEDRACPSFMALGLAAPPGISQHRPNGYLPFLPRNLSSLFEADIYVDFAK